jgi:hypothetical protein
MNTNHENDSVTEVPVREPKNRKRLKKILYFLFFAIVAGIIIFISRGPYISNSLKRLILPELETALKQKVIAKKIYVNIFPFFVEAKDLKVFDENGKRITYAKRVKGYIEPLKLFSKRISIRRLVIKEPVISTDRERIKDLIKNFKAYLETESKLPFKVKIKAVEVSDGVVSLRDEGLKSLICISGLKSEVILGKDPRLKMSVKQFDMTKEGLPELTGNINTSLVIRDNEIEIKDLSIGSYGSEFKGSGLYSGGKLTFKTDTDLLIDSLKRLLNLKERKEGKISAKGEIRIEGLKSAALSLGQWKDIFIDLQLKGDFYIQTLMEILKVKEKVEGLVDFDGRIKGRLSDISGIGKASLQKGNLFGVEIDSLRCNVTYQNNVIKFNNGNADLYNGKAKANASLTLPHVENFNLNVKFQSIDSKAALKLIGWEPEIPAGKVEGELITSGREFQPSGWFVYNAKGKEHQAFENVLNRINNIKGTYSLKDGLLSLSGLQLSTSLSDLKAEGSVYIKKKLLDLKGILYAKEVSDLTLPYYNKLKGSGNFSGKIAGTFDNPEISGRIDISNASLERYKISSITSDLSYNKNLLNIHELLFTSPGEEHLLKGKIKFPEAKELFEFSKAIYEINASIKNADLERIIQIFEKDLPISGRMNADFKIGGKGKDIEITGNSRLEDTVIYKIPVGSASTSFSYINKELSFKNVMVKQGTSVITAEGRVSPDDKFSFRVSSDKILFKDLGLKKAPENASISIQSEGQGTFQAPAITLNGKVYGGIFQEKSLGNGTIYITIKNRDISLKTSLFDENVNLTGKGNLRDPFPWTAELNIKSGRYDFLLGLFVKKVPEEMLFNLGGNVAMRGDRKTISALADIDHLSIVLFGNTFSSESNFTMQINNRKLSFPAFTLKNGNTSFVRMQGGLEIGKEYDIHLEGRSSLSPLKVLSEKVDLLTGEADFAFSLIGKWEDPDIRGDVKISNGSFQLKGNYPRIFSINGHAYVDEDKVIVKKFSGKTGAGIIDVSGLLYHKAFRITRFDLEFHLQNITFSLARDFTLNFKGTLLYRGTPSTQGISGDIEIKSARYKERIDWKKWLFIAEPKEKPKAELSALEQADLNVKISGNKNIYIDNNIARAPVTVDLMLRGTISHPIMLGTLESEEGIAYFNNNEFRIIHASAYFADPNRLNPVIELSAETSLQGYHIRLNLDGQIEHFNLSLSSDPPLEEMDIIALLTVGTPGNQVTGPGGGLSAKEATSFLAGQLQSVYEERLKTITGFERVQVGTYVSKVTGNVEPEVTVSKRLLSNRLYVTYSTPLGSAATEQQIIRLEYQLGKNISLVGVRDERGITGGDIKFRFEFK